MNKKKIILFDIDYTLFDTDKFRDLTYPSLMNLLEQEDLPQYHEKVHLIEHTLISKGGYEPVTFANLLAEALQLKPKREEIERIFYDIALYDVCLYPEVKNILENLEKRNGVILGIISKGETSFQKRKISAVRTYFQSHNVHISLNKFDLIPTVLQKYQKDTLYVVDDSAPFLDNVKKTDKSVVTVLVEKPNRYEKREKPVDFVPDVAITNLSEVLRIVDKKE